MGYTIGEISERLHIPASTLRYYEKQGLLPNVKRSSAGLRVFSDKDIEWLKIIDCLKKAGMQIKEIREYITLVGEGDSSITARKELFQERKQKIQEEIASLQNTLRTLEYKCWFYETAEADGTIERVKHLPTEELPEKHQVIRCYLRNEPYSTI